MHNERRSGQRHGHHGQVPATHNERRCRQRSGATIKYLRCTTSGAAGNGLGTAIKFLRAAAGIGLGTTIKYLRGAVVISFGTTIKYLRRSVHRDQVPVRRRGHRLGTTIKYLRRTTSAAANSSLGTTIKYLVNRNAGAGNNWAKAHIHKSWARIQMNPLVV
jgi:hypothetical protein